MFDIPAAGPAANQVPETSMLPGVVSSGPQKLALKVRRTALNVARRENAVVPIRRIKARKIGCRDARDPLRW